MRKDIYTSAFKAQPWWWEAWTPNNALSQDPPAKTQVVIIGAGYGGLSTALELRRNGIDCVVLERGVFGIGASTRNGGMISGGTNLGKGLGGKSPIAEEFERKKAELMAAGADSLTVLEDIIAREGIDCGLHKTGRFIGAWTPRHYDDMASKVETYNKYANAGTSMVPRERQHEFIKSDYYFGGMQSTRAGHLHPALYYKGLLEAAHKARAILCADIEAERTEKTATGWRVLTAKGPIDCREVVVATNGYTGDLTPRLKRRVVPVASHIIATEELPEPADKMIIPGMRAIGDSKRVLTYYRPSPDGKRLIFGGRARFTPASPEVIAGALYQYMIDRFPQLDGIHITNVWTGNVAFALDYMPHMGIDEGLHYLLGCNGNGVAMMTYLGTQTAKKIAGGRNAPINPLDGREFPEHPFYNGDPSWFLPAIGAWYRTRDWLDRRMAG
ncbi:MAG TPA: FAD-dependent oxidoreductase [Reyranella sp.]|jgi:glycine/D-amino acid oxidase-like deaminating enzyme